MKQIATIVMIGALLQTAVPVLAGHHHGSGVFDFNTHVEDRWLVRARLISIDPDESSTLTGLSADVSVDQSIVPEFDLTYFFTDYFAAEFMLTTAKHDVATNNGVDLGDVLILPPHILLQYHLNPKGMLRPYVGAGLGYIYYYGENSGDAANIDYEGGISYALQTGFDYEINRKWAFNADVKKLFHQTDVSVNDGTITADIDLDPWIFGIGAAYRF